MKTIGSLTVKALICMACLGIAHTLKINSVDTYFVFGVVAGGVMTIVDEITRIN